VASTLCKTDYSAQEWVVFFESLLYLFEYEQKAYSSLDEAKKECLTQDIYDAVDLLELELNAKEGKDLEIEDQDPASFNSKRDFSNSLEGEGGDSFKNSLAVELSNDDP
jgi:hypothetical protein